MSAFTVQFTGDRLLCCSKLNHFITDSCVTFQLGTVWKNLNDPPVSQGKKINLLMKKRYLLNFHLPVEITALSTILSLSVLGTEGSLGRCEDMHFLAEATSPCEHRKPGMAVPFP